MAGISFGRTSLWQYSHSASILFAVLLFTAGFLCTLLWTNSLVQTETSATGPATSTFNQFSPAVSTFSITYQVVRTSQLANHPLLTPVCPQAIFGTAWNAILFVILLVLERDVLPISTPRLRYEIEKAACIVAVVGNAIYSIACIALMATLARLASDAGESRDGIQLPPEVASLIMGSANDRRAGQGATAAFAGFAA